MKLEDQCASLELAKKLKKLGIEQDSLFYWIRGIDWSDYWVMDERDEPGEYDDKISAFTVAELGEMLPWHLEINGKTAFPHIVKVDPSTFNCAYVVGGDVVAYKGERLIFSGTQANACGEMLRYCVENNLITPDLIK